MSTRADIRDPADPRHGTAAGYRAHQYAKHTACAPCRAGRLEQARQYANPPNVACAGCGITCRSIDGVCRSCQQATAKGLTNAPRCRGGCGRSTQRPCGLCRRCEAASQPLSEDDLLLDGWWVRDGLTLRWVALATVEDYRRRAGERVA